MLRLIITPDDEQTKKNFTGPNVDKVTKLAMVIREPIIANEKLITRLLAKTKELIILTRKELLRQNFKERQIAVVKPAPIAAPLTSKASNSNRQVRLR